LGLRDPAERETAVARVMKMEIEEDVMKEGERVTGSKRCWGFHPKAY